MLEPFSRTYLTVSQPGIDLRARCPSATCRSSTRCARAIADAAAEAMHEHLMDAAELLR